MGVSNCLENQAGRGNGDIVGFHKRELIGSQPKIRMSPFLVSQFNRRIIELSNPNT